MMPETIEPAAGPAVSAAPPTALRYALVTPAHNEEEFIELTIRSVIAQTVLPARWVIVSDGSTDRTSDIVAKYASEYEWIDLVVLPERPERSFAGKVRAFNAGYERLRDVAYDVVGNLDADITFRPQYIECLLTKFANDPKLGVAGSPYREGTFQYDYRFSRKEHVSGACQLFRRECFESVGGYVPQWIGAIDLVANVTARMKGWKTETFPEQYCVHHRTMGSANDRVVQRFFKSGYGDYCMGVHPLWQLFRSIYQMTHKPLIISGALLLWGYIWAVMTRAAKPVSQEFVRFREQEQLRWLGQYFKRWLGLERWVRS
jgi:glycosyltransferase involved in cell wall biosynthesis